MNTTSAAVLCGLIVTLGRWARGKTLDVKLVVSILFIAIVLAILSEVDSKLARQFGLLIVVAAVFTYGPDVVSKAGLTRVNPGGSLGARAR